MRIFAGLTIIAAALAAPAAAQPPAPVPIEALAEAPYISSPVLSPDGRKLAARIGGGAGGVERIAVYDLAASRDAAPKMLPAAGVRWFSWAGGDKLLIGQILLPAIFGILPVPITRLVSYDLKSGKTTALGDAEGLLGDDVIYTDPQGRYILLSAQDRLTSSPSVDHIDLATGKVTPVQKARRDIWSWIADGSGEIRGGISYGDNGSWTFFRRDPRTGSIEKVAKGRAPGPDSAVDSIRVMAGSETGLIVTNERTGRFGVYEYDLRTSAVGKAIFEHDRADVTAPLLSADGSRVEGVAFEDDLPRVAWLDPELQKIQAQADKTFPGKVNTIVSRNGDSTIVLIWSGSANDPGIYYVFDRKAKRMDAFAAPLENLVGQPLAEVKPVRYTARDGLEIPAYLTLPRGRAAKDLPLIVMPHGGPFARTSYSFDPWVQMLATRGYAVLQPNFRGSTGFGRGFVEKGYGQMGLAMQDDLDDGVAWLAKQGTIDPKRVCLMGASYGGYAALWGAIRNPETYRCAISFAGVTDIRSMLKANDKMFVARRYSKLHRRKIEGEEKRDLAAVSPLQQAARLKVPVLIAHGERDTTVPAEQSRKLYTALRRLGAPVQGAFYPQADHDLTRPQDGLDLMKRMEAFLELHNPAGAPASAAREAEPVSARIDTSEISAQHRKKAKRKSVAIHYAVAPDGRVENCAVDQSSGVADLDAQVCRIAEERFQYRPAVGGDGQRRAASAAYTLSWEEAAKKDAP